MSHWYMQHEWISEILCWVRKAKPNIHYDSVHNETLEKTNLTYGKRSILVFAWGWEWRGHSLGRSTRALWRLVEMFYVLIMVVVTWLYKFVQNVQLKQVHLLYVNLTSIKLVWKKISSKWFQYWGRNLWTNPISNCMQIFSLQQSPTSAWIVFMSEACSYTGYFVHFLTALSEKLPKLSLNILPSNGHIWSKFYPQQLP